MDEAAQEDCNGTGCERFSSDVSLQGLRAMDAQTPTTATQPVPPVGIPKSIVLAGAGIVALVVVALLVAVALPRQPATYPPGSPEAAFQSYYAAWEEHDLETAYALLSSDVRSDIDVAEYRRIDSEFSWQRSEDRRVVLLSADADGDRALLTLRVDEFYPGAPAGVDRYSREQTVPMVREDGTWYVDQGLAGLEVVYYPAY